MKINTLFLGFLLLIVFAACNTNQEVGYGYADYDRNQDARIDRDEFNTVFSNQGEFEKWDIDNDRRLTSDEWNKGFNNYGSSYPYEEKGLFDDWDTDGDTYVDDEEYNEGFFDLFDADDSDDITEEEWLDN